MAEKRSFACGPWKPQFFRILLPGFHRRLSIPRTFNKYIVRKHSFMATILSPLGNLWRVQVHGDNNYMYFGEGWEEFCQAHNLYAGCFLVFSYEEEMAFRVTVFDSNTCMKEYPIAVEGSHVDDKTKEEFTSFDVMDITEPAEPQEHSHEQQTVGMIKSSASREQRPPNSLGYSRMVPFKITIHSHSLYKGFLHIPVVYGKINGISSWRNVILRDPKMRLWPVNLYHYHQGKRIQSRFALGWAKFCSSNNVEEGDVCVFEPLPEEENFTIHVNILKKHMLPGASDLNSRRDEQCFVIRKGSNEGIIGDEKLEDGQ